MARLGHELLHQHVSVPECRLRFGPGRIQRPLKVLRRLDQPHPLAAAPRDRLDQHRIADLARLRGQQAVVLIRSVIPRHHRHTRLHHQGLGRILQPHRPDGRCRWPDEDQPRLLHRVHEVGVLRQKPIPRMDRLGTRVQRRLNDHIPAQIALRRGRATDMHRPVGHRHMLCRRIRIRIDRHRAHTHRPRRFHHPAGNLAPVRNQYRVKHPPPNLPTCVSSSFHYTSGVRGRAPKCPPLKTAR